MPRPKITIGKLSSFVLSPVKKSQGSTSKSQKHLDSFSSWRSSYSSSTTISKPLLSYTALYLLRMNFNSLLLALYSVMVFTEHKACLTKSSRNITDGFIRSFRMGMVMVAVEFVNSSVVVYYCRHRV